MIDFLRPFSVIGDIIQKGVTSSWPDKGTLSCREKDNVYQATCNAAENMNGNW